MSGNDECSNIGGFRNPCVSASKYRSEPLSRGNADRLPPELKRRINKLAKSSGISVHSLMLEAISEKADELELRTSFHAEADARLSELLTTGVGMDWHDMRTYLTARSSAKKPKHPKCAHGARNNRAADSS
jgi:predicted DNA-binding protein